MTAFALLKMLMRITTLQVTTFMMTSCIPGIKLPSDCKQTEGILEEESVTPGLKGAECRPQSAQQ